MKPNRRNRAFTLVELLIVIAIVGVLSTLAVYGIRRYIASAKTAEARYALGAIGRGSMAAAQSHGTPSVMPPDGGMEPGPPKTWKDWLFTPIPGGGLLLPVPIVVPAGVKYQASSLPGVDFQQEGWKRIHFQLTEPQHYQYHLNAGAGYLGPALGGPDPGAAGAEAAAVGDLDGDGVFGTFTLAMSWDPVTGDARMATQIFVDNEFE